jgi:hypothetical protein
MYSPENPVHSVLRPADMEGAGISARDGGNSEVEMQKLMLTT